MIDFDAFGNVPKLEEAYNDLEENAMPIVAIVFRNKNISNGELEEGILLAYGSLPEVSSTQQGQGKKNTSVSTLLPSRSLERKIGSQPCTSLGSDSQKLLVTGMSGDVRTVMRFALQVSLNHTFDFDCIASGKYLAEKVGKYLQRTTMGAENLLRAHIFIASADDVHPISLHSVDAGGNIVALDAGNAGRHKNIGSELLEKSYRSNFTLVEAKELAGHIINPFANTLTDLEMMKGDKKSEVKEEDFEHDRNLSRSFSEESKEEKEEDQDVLEAKEIWSRLHLDVNFEVIRV